MRNPKALEDLIGYLEKRQVYIPDYGERPRVGLWIASTRVEEFVRCVIRLSYPSFNEEDSRATGPGSHCFPRDSARNKEPTASGAADAAMIN